MTRRRWVLVGVTALVVTGLMALAAHAGEKCRGKAQLPEAAAKALAASFPDAKVEGVEAEEEDGVALFDVELESHGEDREVEVTPEGAIVEVAVEIDMQEVPEAAAAVIRKAAEGARVKVLSREEVRAEIRDAKVVALEAPRTVYSAELKKGHQRGEIGVLADGTVVEELVWRTRQEQEEKDRARPQ